MYMVLEDKAQLKCPLPSCPLIAGVHQSGLMEQEDRN